jgi:hypothetical protein
VCSYPAADRYWRISDFGFRLESWTVLDGGCLGSMGGCGKGSFQDGVVRLGCGDDTGGQETYIEEGPGWFGGERFWWEEKTVPWDYSRRIRRETHCSGEGEEK